MAPTAEVVSAYESAMSQGDMASGRASLESAARGTRFLKWHFEWPEEDDNPYQLDSLGEVTVRFDLRLDAALHRGHHGVALFTANRELIWGRAMDGLRLPPGLHSISYTFPCLPLRPGPYFWQVSFWEEGKLLDLPGIACRR